MKASTKAKLILTAVLCFASFTAGTAWRDIAKKCIRTLDATATQFTEREVR